MKLTDYLFYNFIKLFIKGWWLKAGPFVDAI